jgi:hypothetical protein
LSKRVEQILIGLLGEIREIHFYSCLFG